MSRKKKQTWVIQIGRGYGSFLFEGTEQEAEQRRKDKCIWEQAPGRKRLATQVEVLTQTTSPCRNHPNFESKSRYKCNCENCVKDRVSVR